ncbi:choice-of-anchor L domain-containing protein [Flavobacterium sp. CLA17]|uniref:choice-of-anchor L domain-containing protein n=1 Tax=Flavobacterium sp. CLA17 TaxID=2724135 RepID=UPI001492112A|nr:choice-of-anchor L domain-containing protein [Flavobacterium sp. CLA17]QSB25180.1 choice-of-anchor L domain-containing protein [Flavobacterium sp. CLA17]
MKKTLFVLLIVLTANLAKAQLVIDNSTLTPQQLAQNILLGQGINISNIKFNGSAAATISDQIAVFDNGATTNIGINKGLILSTGNAIIAKGPNDQGQATLPTSNPVQGDPDLSILTNNQPIQNAAVLEFDFVPVGNKLTFNFVFASDEYPEFVNDSYNDNFGFFIAGPGITGPYSGNAKNIALIPTTSLPVSINNLNNGNSNNGPCEYCQYYVNNDSGTTIQYDGFTKVIQAVSDVQCGQTYHIKLAIANVLDNNYDSAVFIEGASFSSSGINLGEDLQICSATNYTLKTGLDASVVHEWTFNGVVIPLQTGPEITVNQSGNYGVKATPIGIGCPVSDEIKIQFSTVMEPYLYCGTKTANSITFDWLALGYAEFSVAYKIGTNAIVDVGFLGKAYSYTVQNVPHGETVTITVTPVGTPAECFGPNSISCILDTCVLTPTITNSQGPTSQQTCADTIVSDMSYTIGGGATTASITSGSLPDGVTGTLVGNVFTISGTATSSGTYNFTITTSGGCGTNASVTGSIVILERTLPSFAPINAICEGGNFILPLQSINGIPGTWSPAVNNLTTTEYTFTPNSGQCATTTKLTVAINLKTVPVFTAVAPICEGETIVLPAQSNNGITGTWTPAINNITTTEYTFVPNLGECAATTKLNVTIIPKTSPVFTAIAPICEGETIVLPSQSDNGIRGTWTPAINNSTTTEYTFTPNSGQCSTTAKLTVSVNPKTIPLFTTIAPICEGEIIMLPVQSNNGIAGTWLPAIDNLNTTEYTFTPNNGQCAASEKFTVIVYPKPQPKIEDGKICIENATNTLIQPYLLDTQLNNSLYNFEWFLEANKIENQNGSTLEAKETGHYAVIAIDKNTNCISDIAEAIVTSTKTDSGEITIVQSESFSENSTVTINVKNASGIFEYQIDNSDFQFSNQFTDVSSGKHSIAVRSVNGCTNLTKEIIVIGYPKFFTPNGDAHNDTWNIIGFDGIQNDRIFIFDRYGKLLKQLNSKVLGWDGTYNGYQMPATDYWFKIIFTEDKIEKEFKSHFTLKR